LGIALVELHAGKFVIGHEQPADMTPNKGHKGAVRVRRLVGMLMMQTVHTDPSGRRVLQTAHAENCQRMFEPLRAIEAAVRQQPVIAKINTQCAKDVRAGERKSKSCPAKKPWQKREERYHMKESKADGVRPIDPAAGQSRRSGEALRFDAFD